MTLTVAVAFALFAAATFAKLSVGKGKALFVSDGFYYYSYTVSLVLDRDLDFSNQYRFNKGWSNPRFTRFIKKTGRLENCFGIGAGLLWLPAFSFIHLGVLTAKTIGLPLATTGYELYYQLPTYLWSFLLGFLGMGLLYRLLVEVFEQRHAFWATVGILFGTALSNYAFLHANMSHWVSAACATAYLYSVFQVYRRPEDWRWWLISGIALGVAAMVRYQNAALGVLIVGLLWQLIRQGQWQTLAVGVIAHIAATIVTFLPQMLAWRAIYGELLPNLGFVNPYVYPHMHWLSPNFSYILWLFVYSPLLLLALWGFVRPFPKTLPTAFVVSVGLAILGQLYVNCALPELGGYGVRRMTDFFPYFGIALANALRILDEQKGQKWSLSLVGVGVVINWLLIANHYLSQLLSGGHFHF
jgi:4-amino-4-deoxy-L-arabinose transferase-like glycosyltransferase